ncbi:MAG TPA: exosortase H [Candidatus Deferrimicrobium sp.]|nr:exosortase H [Candidatus Deferrimicrobium sp.]
MGQSGKKGRQNEPHDRNARNVADKFSFWKWPSRLPPALRFVLSFLFCLAVLGFAYSHVTAKYHDNLGWLMDVTAFACGAVLDVFSDSVTYSGKYVSYNGFSVEIIDECTGLLEMVIYLAAVVSFSAGVRKKLIGLATGVPAIYLFNILRIIVLLIAGSMSKRVFDFMHLYFWQATLILMIATVWVGWLVLVVYREKKPVAVSP